MNADIIAFIEGGVSIVLASRDASFEPSLARASGCRVDAANRRVRIFCSQRAGAQLIEDLRQGAPLAVTFSKPSTHRSLQLKAAHAELTPLAQADWDAIEISCDAFASDAASHGHSRRFVTTVLGLDPEDAIAIDFAPEEAFNQTPGSNAGEVLAVR